MIGFSMDKPEQEPENVYSDWESSHTKTNDTLKKSFNKPASPLDMRDTTESSWNNINSGITKPVLQQVEINKK